MGAVLGFDTAFEDMDYARELFGDFDSEDEGHAINDGDVLRFDMLFSAPGDAVHVFLSYLGPKK